MFNAFSATPDLSTYAAVPAQIDLAAVNTPASYGAAISAKMDFSDYDRVDEQALNLVLWHHIKGPNVPMPPPVRRALVAANGLFHFPSAAADDDDDVKERRRK